MTEFTIQTTRYLLRWPPRTAHGPEGARSGERSQPALRSPSRAALLRALPGAPLTWRSPLVNPIGCLSLRLSRLIGCCGVPPLVVTRARSLSVRYLEGSEEGLPPPPFTGRPLSLATEPACRASPLAAQAAGFAPIGWRAGAERCAWAGELPAKRSLWCWRRCRPASSAWRARREALPASPQPRGAGWPPRAGCGAARCAEGSGAQPQPPARTMRSGREPGEPRLRDPSGAAVLSAPGSA